MTGASTTEPGQPATRFPPLARALAAQAVAGAIAFASALAFESSVDLRAPLFAILAAQGAIAAVLGIPLGLKRWWIPIQAALPPAAALLLALALPGWVYLLAFVALVLVYWNAARGRVPLYLSNRATKEALVALLPAKRGVHFLDIGSGLGGPIAALALARKDGAFVGLESAPLPFALSWLRLAFLGPPNARVRLADFWRHDLAGHDIVYAFLSPVPMTALYDKARAEMDPGALLISNSFEVPGHAPDRIIEVDDARRTRLLVWQM